MIDAADGRLFVVLTVAEAAAVLRPRPSPDRDRGLAKIRSALSGACQLTGLDLPVAPLNSPPVPDVDDYVPWRDEADGLYR